MLILKIKHIQNWKNITSKKIDFYYKILRFNMAIYRVNSNKKVYLVINNNSW